MEVAVNIRHQNNSTYPEVRDAVLEAERLGFGAAFFPDHYVPTETIRGEGASRQTAALEIRTAPSDAWALISVLVPQTSCIRLGTMMTSSTFRHPGPLAVSVAQLNAISVGRIGLGLGTNWHEGEHRAFGVPYPPQGERYRRLEEQLALIAGLWDEPGGSPFEFTGRYFTVEDGRRIARPAGVPHARLIVGGTGLRRTPRLAARFADECNTVQTAPDAARPFYEACTAACEAIGRNPETLRRSVLLRVCCGRDDADIDQQLAGAGVTRDQLRGVLVCRPSRLLDVLLTWRDAGIDSVVVSPRGGVDLDNLRVLGELLPAVAAG